VVLQESGGPLMASAPDLRDVCAEWQGDTLPPAPQRSGYRERLWPIPRGPDLREAPHTDGDGTTHWRTSDGQRYYRLRGASGYYAVGGDPCGDMYLDEHGDD
jgi:hypothetical protein